MNANLVTRKAVRNLAALIQNIYPGRGIVLGVDESGLFVVMLYWIMGRSDNSRNRVFGSDGGRLFTKAADPAKVTDPSLIIYNAMDENVNQISNNGLYIVSNGHQTNCIRDADNWKQRLSSVLAKWQYEPDSPNFTNRISGVSRIERRVTSDKKLQCHGVFQELSVLQKSPYGDDCIRSYYQYENIPAGYGYCVTTYSSDGDPLPAFDSVPYVLPLEGDIEEMAKNYWDVLNPDNRVSLAVKFIPLQGGDSQIKIVNRFTEVIP
jgi:hypothetical protein